MRIWSRILNIVLKDTKGTRELDDALTNRFVRENLDKSFQAWTRTTHPENPEWRP